MRKTKKIIAFLLAFIMTILAPFSPSTQYFTANAASSKIFDISPSRVDIGETVTIKVLLQYTQKADVYVEDSSGNKIETIANNVTIGGYNGTFEIDSDGNLVVVGKDKTDNPTIFSWDVNDIEAGRYTIVVMPETDILKQYADRGSVNVGGGASGGGSTSLDVDPNLSTGKFKFHGYTESGEDTSQSVTNADYKKRVYVDTVSVELTVEGKKYNAPIGSSKWNVTLSDPITPYKKVKITGKKVNEITIVEQFLEEKEVPDGTDEEGNPKYKTVYEWGEKEKTSSEETINLDSVYIADHVTRQHDRIVHISVIYFYFITNTADIRKANDKEDSPWNPKHGDHVLIIEPSGVYYDVDSVTTFKLNEVIRTQYSLLSPDPVDIMSGNYIYKHKDIEITGGFPIEFSRWYNSRDNYNGLLGRNWHTSYEYSLWEKSDEVEIIHPDGRRIRYRYTGGKYVPVQAGEYDRLEKTNGKFTLTKKDKTQYAFDSAGKIIEIKDSNGNITKFVYRGDFLAEIRTYSGYITIDYTNKGLIRQIRDNTGRVVKYGYNSNNELTKFIYANGESILYDYDNNSRLTKVTSPDRNAGVSNEYDSQGRVVKQTFPDESIMLFEYDTVSNKTTVTERNGQVTTYYYDDIYRVTQVDHADGTEQYTYNEQNELASYTDKSGSKTSYQYDARGNTVEIDKDGDKTYLAYNENDKITSITDPLGNATTYGYDNNGNLANETDPRGNTTSYIYDAKGQVIQIIKSDGSITNIAYDTKGNGSKITDARGNSKEYQYDSLNRVIAVTDSEGSTTKYEYNEEDKISKITYSDETYINYEYDENGNTTKYTDQNNNSESYEYDKSGRITKLTDVMGYVTTYQYDKMGNLIGKTDKRGNTTTYTYDQYNNLKSKIDPEGNITYYEYDNNSNLTKEIDSRGKETTYEYDIKGNLTKITDPYGNVVSYEYDKLGQVEKITDKKGNVVSYSYDPLGNIVGQIDKNNNQVTYEHDSLGRLTRKIDQLGRMEELVYDKEGNILAAIDSLGNTQKYDYDGENRITQITDKRGAVTKYTYDQQGRLTQITDSIGGENKLSYDDLGNISSIKDERGNTTTYTYDKLGNLVEEKGPYGRKTTYNYDENSNLTQITDPMGYNMSYTYDKTNRVTKVTDKEGNATNYIYDEAGNITTVTDPLGRTKKLQYDNLGRVTTVADKDGKTITYTHDKENNITSVKDKMGNILSYEYDPIGNIIKETNERGYETKYTYDAVGNLIEKIDPKENSIKIDYDLLGRTSKVTDEEGRITSYTYDEAGNITQITDAIGNATEFTYDLLGRVISKTDRDGNTTKYTYDEVGNIIKETNARGYASEYDYDKNGRLISKTDANENKTAYEYDSIGRMIEIENPDGTKQSFTYDKEDRIKTVTDENKNTTEYTYDAVGNMTKTTDAKGNEAYYTYDDMDRLIEVKVINEITTMSADIETLTVSETVYGGSNIENLTSTEKAKTVYEEVYDLVPQEINMETTIEEQITIYQYDDRGLIKKVIDPLGYGESYSYDEAGNMIIKVDKEGNQTEYGYDELDLVKQINYNDGETVIFEYDKTGNLKRATEEIGTAEFEYDPIGRLTKHVDHRGNITSYTWTKEGLKESIEYPDQEKVRYSYDQVGNLAKVTDSQGKITEYEYDPANRLLEEILPNQIKTKYTYDEMDRLTSLVQTNVDGTLIDEYGYEYDEAGNILEKSQYGEYTRQYTYDELERITEIKVGDETLKYIYDSIGNRRQQYEIAGEEIQNILDYEYDIANRLLKFDNEKYKYDKNGNLIETKKDNKVTNKYEYDDKSRLVYAKNKHDDVQTYSYDFMGNRVEVEMHIETNGGGNRPDPKDKKNEKKGNNGKGIGVGEIPPGHEKREIDINDNGTSNGGNPKPGWGHQYNRTTYRVEYTYDITSPYQNVLMQYGEHYQAQKYTYGVGRISIDFIELDDENNGWIPKTAPTRLEENSQRLYYIEDELGSTKRLISAEGKVSVSYKYYDFGSPSTTTHFDVNWSGPDNLFGYTGYEWDNIAEMWYAKARYYNSDIGRFAAHDPLKGSITDIQSLNLYPYVKNNPLKYVDPDGRDVEVSSDGGGSVRKKSSNNKPDYLGEDILIVRLESDPNNINYQKLLEIIEEDGITDFTYEVFQSIVDSEIKGSLESTSYILGNNFKYLAKYNGVSSYANFYVLMVEGEITLIRVGRDKTQVGFYDITKTDFFSQKFDKRSASAIFDDYLPTTGLDTDLNNSKKLSNENYKFYKNKATNTAETFWKYLESDSDVIKELARGLDTIRGEEDGTGIAEDFGEVYEKTKYYPEKDNAFVLGEIYGHADGLNDFNWFRVAGKNKYRYWIADVENPNTIPTGWFTRRKQKQQNDRWRKYGKGR